MSQKLLLGYVSRNQQALLAFRFDFLPRDVGIRVLIQVYNRDISRPSRANRIATAARFPNLRR